MKKVIKPIFALVITATMVACGGATDKAKEMVDDTKEMAKEKMEEVMQKSLSVDTEGSKVMWKGSMLGLYSHEGTLNITDGVLELKGTDVIGGKFMVDMTSITPTDDSYGEENTPEMLVGHLSSADFFLVDSFPTASFVVKSADMAARTITGGLTVRGTTQEETIEGVSIDMESKAASGVLTFNRQDYGVAFTHPAKDKVLSDDIELAIDLRM